MTLPLDGLQGNRILFNLSFARDLVREISVGGLITYGEEGARKHQTIPDTKIQVSDLVDDTLEVADIEVIKSFYGPYKISFRLID